MKYSIRLFNSCLYLITLNLFHHLSDTHKMDKNNNVFMLSLDAVDLNYLPITHKLDGKMMPLWAKQNLDMRNNDYYEFKINSVNTEEEEDDESDEEMDYTTCYICDIDVPSPFLNQHYDSVKHKINLKITNTAMERVKKSINTINNREVSKNSSLYFCPVCVIVVDMKEKKLHNRSVAHKNAVSVENFLQDFSSLYTKEDENAEFSDSDNSEVKTEIDSAINRILNKVSKSVFPKTKINGVKKQVDSESYRKEYQEISIQKQNGKALSETSDLEELQIEKVDALERDAAKNYKELIASFDVESIVNTKPNKSQFTEEINHKIIKDDDDETNSKDDNLENNGDEIKIATQLKPIKRTHHHLETSLCSIYCRICKKNINHLDENHISDLNHEINYEKFLDENAIYKKDSRLMECKICNESFICEKEIEHSDQIRHISNFERYKKRNSH
ncbi:unnamed protein product, partial [Brenthis ino]